MSDGSMHGTAPGTIARWEYKVVYVDLPRIMRQAGADRLSQTLNQWSLDGWEAYQTLEVSAGGDVLQFYVHLKRPVLLAGEEGASASSASSAAS